MIKTITLESHVGRDGVLNLRVPVEMSDVDVRVDLTLEPLDTARGNRTPEELGWPPGFFEKTAGSIPDFPDIGPEGDFEVRDKLE